MTFLLVLLFFVVLGISLRPNQGHAPSGDSPRVWRHTGHLHFDPKSLRILLPADDIEALPFKTITDDELYEVMCHDDFNPPRYYAAFDPEHPKRRIVNLQPNEVGQDLQYRYILTPDPA